MNTFIIGIIAGIISGILASIIAHLIVYLSKPRIEISENIAKQNGDNGPEYRIKIVNKSKAYAKDLSIQVNLIHYGTAINGTILSAEPLKLARNDIAFIEPYNKNDLESKYAIRIRILSDLKSRWQDDTIDYIEAKVFCTNEFTGAGKVFSQKYSKKLLIKEGVFAAGKSTDII